MLTLIELVELIECKNYQCTEGALVNDTSFIVLKKRAEESSELAKALETIGKYIEDEPVDRKSKWQQRLERIKNAQDAARR